MRSAGAGDYGRGGDRDVTGVRSAGAGEYGRDGDRDVTGARRSAGAGDYGRGGEGRDGGVGAGQDDVKHLVGAAGGGKQRGAVDARTEAILGSRARSGDVLDLGTNALHFLMLMNAPYSLFICILCTNLLIAYGIWCIEENVWVHSERVLTIKLSVYNHVLFLF